MSPVPWLAGLVAATAIPPALLVGLVWRRRTTPGARPYAVMLGIIVAFDLVYAFSLVFPDPNLHEWLYPIAALIKLCVMVPWVLFALEYTGRGQYATRRTAGLLLAPAALALPVFLSSAREGLLVASYDIEWVAGLALGSFQNGPLWSLLGLYGFLLLGAGHAMLLEFVLADRGRYGIQTGLFALAGLIPGILTGVHILRIGPIPLLDLTALGYAAGAILVGYGLRRYELFTFTPATRRVGQAAAIEDLGDATVILDDRDRIVDLNDRAAGLLGLENAEALGGQIDDVLGETDALDGADPRITLETDRGHREFDVTTAGIDGPRSDRIGRTLVFHDITEEKQRRQRFEVLNRVLRHNLRNSMNAVMGFTNELETQVNGESDWLLEGVKRQTRQVVELSEKASAIDRVTGPSEASSTFRVAAACEAVADDIGSTHGAPITVHVPEGLTVTANCVILEEVLRFAITSMISYNCDSQPKIVLTATPTDGTRPWIDLLVTSSGNPVPPAERAVIERGEETPLDHSHDLDLWLVSWGVDTLGGELTFITDEDRPGLKLRLPDLSGVENSEPAEQATDA